MAVAAAASSSPNSVCAAARRTMPAPVRGAPGVKNATTSLARRPKGTAPSLRRRKCGRPGQSGRRSRKSKTSSKLPRPARNRCHSMMSRATGPARLAARRAAAHSPSSISSKPNARGVGPSAAAAAVQLNCAHTINRQAKRRMRFKIIFSYRNAPGLTNNTQTWH